VSDLINALDKLPNEPDNWELWVMLVKAAFIAEHRCYYHGAPVTTCSDFIFCVDSAEERARISARLEEEAAGLGAMVIRGWPRVFEQAYATLHRTLQREDPKTGEHEVVARKALWILCEDEAPSSSRFERAWCAVNWPAHHAGDGVVPSIGGGPAAAYWPEIEPATVIFARIARRATAGRLLRNSRRYDPALERRQAVFLKRGK
jgi:hypothetical protein